MRATPSLVASPVGPGRRLTSGNMAAPRSGAGRDVVGAGGPEVSAGLSLQQNHNINPRVLVQCS